MIIISLGSNVTSRWGNSDATILTAFSELENSGVEVLRHSRLYKTQPYGLVDQPDFTNAAVLVRTSRPPAALLKLLKSIEARAGRREAARWGPRPLDLDIIDYNKRILNWAQQDRQTFKYNQLSLTLPHPGIESRAFVLKPILDIAPLWHHPVTGASAAQLLRRLSRAKMGQIIEFVDERLIPGIGTAALA